MENKGSHPVRTSASTALADGLLTSSTYRHEHQITIDMVYDTLLPWCSYLDYEAEPSIVGGGPTCNTWRRSWKDGSPTRRRRSSSWWAGPAPHPGRERLAPWTTATAVDRCP